MIDKYDTFPYGILSSPKRKKDGGYQKKRKEKLVELRVFYFKRC